MFSTLFTRREKGEEVLSAQLSCQCSEVGGADRGITHVASWFRLRRFMREGGPVKGRMKYKDEGCRSYLCRLSFTRAVYLRAGSCGAYVSQVAGSSGDEIMKWRNVFHAQFSRVSFGKDLHVITLLEGAKTRTFETLHFGNGGGSTWADRHPISGSPQCVGMSQARGLASAEFREGFA
jgi:hypothetical protein